MLISDIDECSMRIDGCSHTCANTIGSFYCMCPDGFQLSDNLKDCTGE